MPVGNTRANWDGFKLTDAVTTGLGSTTHPGGTVARLVR